jgi:hypothetical protein
MIAMRARRPVLLLLALAPAALAAACGSSESPPSAAPDGGSTNGSGDGAEASIDAAVDSTTQTADAAPDATPLDASRIDSAADAGLDATAPTSDGALFGASCPAFDAAGFVAAAHGSLPTMVYGGGGILAAPQIITFTFPDTPAVATLQAFGETLTQTPWFAAVTKDYCLNDGGTCAHAGSPGIGVAMDAAAASTYVDTYGGPPSSTGADLDSFVVAQIAGAVTAGTIPAPAANPNGLYAFYFPPESTIFQGSTHGGKSCDAFGAYHGSIPYSDGTPIAYAIMPDCPTGDPTADVADMVFAAGHEFAEATTDPYPVTGWYLDEWFGAPPVNPSAPQIRNDPWTTTLLYGEVADNCEALPISWTLDSGLLVPRIWSTSAAASGQNPCVPVPPGESYYNASTDKALYVADVGSTFTIDVSVFADQPRPSWRLDALDYTPNPAKRYLQLEFVDGADAGDGVSRLLCVNNGTTAQLRVTLLADPGADAVLAQHDAWPEADGVIVSADVANAYVVPLPDGGAVTEFPWQYWAFAVVTPAVARTIGLGDAGL